MEEAIEFIQLHKAAIRNYIEYRDSRSRGVDKAGLNSMRNLIIALARRKLPVQGWTDDQIWKDLIRAYNRINAKGPGNP